VTCPSIRCTEKRPIHFYSILIQDAHQNLVTEASVKFKSRGTVGGLIQRLRGHQSFQEASLLSKLAGTQRTHFQRLSSENKGDFPYVPFRAGYRNGEVWLIPYIITCYFIGCFNLWGEVTFLWSLGYIPHLRSSFVLL
jgi:hypothetical protein